MSARPHQIVGAMESDGILECYLSSVIERQLRYLTYIVDGDTRSFQNVIDANPYPGFVIKKGLVQGYVHLKKRTRSHIMMTKRITQGKE